jgi:porin
MTWLRSFIEPGVAFLLLLPLTDVRSQTTPGNDQGGANPATNKSWRDTLEDRGITFSVESDTDVFVNVSGGIKRDAVVFNWLKLGLNLDLFSLTGLAPLHDTNIHAEAHYPAGTDISSYVGDIGGVSNNAAYNSFRLYELWIQKEFKAGPLVVSLKTGLLSADQEFDLISAASLFINSSFAADLGFGGTVPIPIYPFNAPAARLQLSIGDERFVKATFRSGVFDGNSAAPKLGFALDAPIEPSFNKYGVDPHLNPNAGLIFINELELDFLKPEPAGASAPTRGHWLFGPGRFLAGGFYTTDRFADVYEAQLEELGAANAPNRVREISGNYGIYLVWEEKFYEEALDTENGLYAFARGTVLPADRNFVSVATETGVVYKGVFRRAKDTLDSLGLGFGYSGISDNVEHANRVARQEGLASVPNLSYEAVLEATYSVPVNSHWQMQPDLQWVIHPGGSDRYHNAVVLGVRSTVTF